MKDTKRALRRHHRQRMIVRTMKLLVHSGVPEADRLQQVLRWYKNRQRCSCYMCGHRRKWWGRTTQERRRLDTEELEDGNQVVWEAGVSDVPFEIVSEQQAWSRVCRIYQWRNLQCSDALSKGV